MKEVKTKKIGKIIVNALLYIFLALAIFSVFLTLFSKKSPDGATDVLGYQLRIVTSESMAECDQTDVSDYRIKSIPLRSMVFVKLMPSDPAKANDWYADLKTGDVLTFRYVYTKQVTITHRITSIEKNENGGYTIHLAGDNKNTETDQLTQVIDTSIPNNTNYVIGKVTGKSFLLGVVMSFLMQPLAMIFIIMVPCVWIIIMEVIKIVRILGADKAAKVAHENAQQKEELEELRRKLAELEREKAEQASVPTDNVEDKTE